MHAKLLLAELLLCVDVATGHGSMNFPRPRNANPKAAFSADASCIGDACFWYQVGCFNGCTNCTGSGKYLYPSPSDFPSGCSLTEPTNNDPATRTWDPHNQSERGDFTKYNPWRSPGKAPVHDPCGAASGYKKAGQGPYAPEVPLGYAVWAKGSEVLPEGNATVWKAGGLAEVAWSIAAQHGGGYQYRLCPKGSALTEDCFQANPLAFAGSAHTIRYNDGSAPDFAINATDLSTGVLPVGSTWRRNPIPACNCDIGACGKGGRAFSKPYSHSPDPISADVCPTGTMYPAPFKNAAGLVGYLTHMPITYSIVDKVKVPSTPGDYVLSWRWDCEETNQVWNSCADIRVSETEPPTPPPAPAPPAPPPAPPTPKPTGQGCKKLENPTCKGLSGGKKGACVYYGCKKCHDDTTWDCDECCDSCSRTFEPTKKIHYCADKKAGFTPWLRAKAQEQPEDPMRDADPGLVEF